MIARRNALSLLAAMLRFRPTQRPAASFTHPPRADGNSWRNRSKNCRKRLKRKRLAA